MLAGAAIFRLLGWQMKVIPIWIFAVVIALVCCHVVTRAIACRGTENSK